MPHEPLHPRLHAYLKRATFGLAASLRDEVWAELEEHVMAKTQEMSTQGLSPEDAFEQALAGMGSARRVGLAMPRPPLLLGVLCGVVLCGAAIYGQATMVRQHHVQLLVLPLMDDVRSQLDCMATAASPARRDGVVCPISEGARRPGGPYVNLSALRDQFSVLGVTLSTSEGGRSTVANGGRVEVLETRPAVNGQVYARLNDLFHVLRRALPSVELRDVDHKPRIRVANMSLSLSPNESQLSGYAFYLGVAADAARRMVPWPAHVKRVTSTGLRTTFATDLGRGDVVAVLSRDNAGGYAVDVAFVESSGEVTVRFPTPVHLARSIQALNREDGRRRVALVRLTGESFQLVDPDAGRDEEARSRTF